MRIETETNLEPTDTWFGVFVKVNGNALVRKRGVDRDIPDVDTFFESLHTEGILPLFTCRCGVFGCGGYYVGVSSDAEAWVLHDWYGAQHQKRNGEFLYRIPWQRVRQVALEIVEARAAIKGSNPAGRIVCGAAGTDLAERLPVYLGCIAALTLPT